MHCFYNFSTHKFKLYHSFQYSTLRFTLKNFANFSLFILIKSQYSYIKKECSSVALTYLHPFCVNSQYFMLCYQPCLCFWTHQLLRDTKPKRLPINTAKPVVRISPGWNENDALKKSEPDLTSMISDVVSGKTFRQEA